MFPSLILNSINNYVQTSKKRKYDSIKKGKIYYNVFFMIMFAIIALCLAENILALIFGSVDVTAALFALLIVISICFFTIFFIIYRAYFNHLISKYKSSH
jgi:hypothetical protein